MAIIKLETASWGSYLDKFSVNLPQQEAEIMVESLKLGSQIEAQSVRLYSVNYDHKDDIIIVSLEGLEHIIHRPVSIFVDEAEGQVMSLEVIDREDMHHLILLRNKTTS